MLSFFDTSVTAQFEHNEAVSAAELETATMDRIRNAWATLAGAPTFPEAGRGIVTNAASQICPPGWSGIVAIGGGILATTPDEERRVRLAQMLERLALTDDWSERFGELEVLGPARLAFADQRTVIDGNGGPAWELCSTDDPDVTAFVADVPDADRDEASIEACTSRLVCVRDEGCIVAAAGHRRWLDMLAHMSVLVAPRHRGVDLATTIARVATRHAIECELVPQWRARPAASQAVARKLGYVDLGQQISIRLP